MNKCKQTSLQLLLFNEANGGEGNRASAELAATQERAIEQQSFLPLRSGNRAAELAPTQERAIEQQSLLTLRRGNRAAELAATQERQ